jgi:hypothetical protein
MTHSGIEQLQHIGRAVERASAEADIVDLGLCVQGSLHWEGDSTFESGHVCRGQ